MEKSENNLDKKLEIDAQTALSASVQPLAAAPLKEKKRTVGNIIYDFGVFGSIAWAGVAILSALSAHEAMHGKLPAFNWLRTLNDKVYGGLKNTLSKTLLKNASEETLHGYAKGTTMFVTLGMGGNALMAPIKWMEDNRQKNAARIDHLLGTTPPDPETIKAEPQQTWKSVFEGRLISWGTSYLAFLALGPKLTRIISSKFGKAATEGWLKLRPAANPAIVRRWSDIAAFDTLFTIITAALTYGFSRAIAKHDDKKLDMEDRIYEINPVNPTLSESAEQDPAVSRQHQTLRETVRRAPPELYSQKIAEVPETVHSRA